MTKKADETKEPEAALAADVTENEEEVKPTPKPTPLAPVIEQVENHDTVPAWFKPLGDQLTRIEEALKSKPTEPKPIELKPIEPKQPEPEASDDQTRKTPKKSKIKLWRTF